MTQRPAITTTLHPALLRYEIRERSVVYGASFYIGLTFAATFLLNRIPTSLLLYRIGAGVLSSPGILAGLFLSWLVAVSGGLWLRREPPLLLLAHLTAGVPFALWLAAVWPPFQSWPGSFFFTAYTLLALALPLRWVLVGHRRLRRLAGYPGQ